MDPKTAKPADTAEIEAAAEPGIVMAGANAQVVEIDKDWTKVLVVAGGSIPSGEKRPVIVVERQTPPTVDDKGAVTEEAKIKRDGYPTKGDIYIRSDLDTKMPDDAAEVLTFGVNLGIGGNGGFNSARGLVNYGPVSPTYAAVNVAIQRGAKQVEISGATKAEQERLDVWFRHNRRPTKSEEPLYGSDVEITFS